VDRSRTSDLITPRCCNRPYGLHPPRERRRLPKFTNHLPPVLNNDSKTGETCKINYKGCLQKIPPCNSNRCNRVKNCNMSKRKSNIKRRTRAEDTLEDGDDLYSSKVAKKSKDKKAFKRSPYQVAPKHPWPYPHGSGERTFHFLNESQ
jgi:hypothetical protein